ncbi:hypothetical protein [Streptomyces sp. P3]|uniref:hypothetical protein n=1 Tax=Streptomyces sp. P3 TaxID=2135430 RepID=UPI00131F0019|nr:hypothetical protein [Streptomyces sp. P3]
MAGQQRVPYVEGDGAGTVLAQGGQELASVQGGEQLRIGAAAACAPLARNSSATSST